MSKSRSSSPNTPGNNRSTSNVMVSFILPLLLMAGIPETALFAQLLNINLVVQPQNIINTQPTPFSFVITPDVAENQQMLAGGYTFVLSASENQQIQIRYPKTAALVCPGNDTVLIGLNLSYNNAYYRMPENTDFADLQGTQKAEYPVVNFPIHHIPRLIRNLRGNPAYLYTWLRVELESPIPANSTCTYEAEVLIQIEYN